MECWRAIVWIGLVGCGRFGFASNEPAPDAPPVDAAAALGPTILFQDDFEDLSASQQQWIPEGNIVFGSPRGRNGSHALEATVTGAPQDVMALKPLQPGVSTGTLAIRAWYFNAPGLQAPHANVISARAVAQADATRPFPASASMESTLVLDNVPGEGGLQLFADPTGPTADRARTSSREVPIDGAWYCLEVDIDVTTQDTGSMRFYCNDRLAAVLDHYPTLIRDGYAQVEVGQFAVSPAQNPVTAPASGTMYVDDVVIASAATLPGPSATKAPVIACGGAALPVCGN